MTHDTNRSGRTARRDNADVHRPAPLVLPPEGHAPNGGGRQVGEELARCEAWQVCGAPLDVALGRH